MRTKLAAVFEQWELELFPCSYDIVGDIAVIRAPNAIEDGARKTAEAIMQTNRNVRAVFRQTSPVSGNLRLRHLAWVCGEKRTETTHKEFGCTYIVDLEKCYFSPRLSYERMRIARQVKPGEVVVNMFAGVGCFSILIGRYAKAEKVYSVDINPDAVRYMAENVRLNKVVSVVEPVLGDAGEIIEDRLSNVADRVLMPLPEKAYEYLEYALLALKPGGGMTHYYDFTHAAKGEAPAGKVELKVSQRLRDLGATSEVCFSRVVRMTGPRWYQVVLDILVHKKR